MIKFKLKSIAHVHVWVPWGRDHRSLEIKKTVEKYLIQGPGSRTCGTVFTLVKRINDSTGSPD